MKFIYLHTKNHLESIYTLPPDQRTNFPPGYREVWNNKSIYPYMEYKFSDFNIFFSLNIVSSLPLIQCHIVLIYCPRFCKTALQNASNCCQWIAAWAIVTSYTLLRFCVYVIRFPLVFDLLQSRHFFLCHKGYQYETEVWLVSLDTSFFSTQKIPFNAFWISIHNLLFPTTKRKQQVVEIKFSLIPKPKFKMHADL